MTKSTNIRNWVIYKITSPTGNVYVGKTCSLNSRISQYKTAGKSLQQQPVIYNSIKKYGWGSHSFEIIDQFESKFDFASGKEIFWIRSYMSNLNKFRGGLGMNLTDGGDGKMGAIVSDETKKKIGDAHRGKAMSTWQKEYLSTYNKQNPSRGMLGKTHTVGTKILMSKAKKGMISVFKGKNHRQESIDKIVLCQPNRKPIVQLDANGSVIKEHISIRAASIFTGIHGFIIRRLLNGANATSTPYKFNFK